MTHLRRSLASKLVVEVTREGEIGMIDVGEFEGTRALDPADDPDCRDVSGAAHSEHGSPRIAPSEEWVLREQKRRCHDVLDDDVRSIVGVPPVRVDEVDVIPDTPGSEAASRVPGGPTLVDSRSTP